MRLRSNITSLRSCIAVVAALFLWPAILNAHGGNISVSADPQGSSCSLQDVAPGLFTVFVVHTNLDSAIAAFLEVTESIGFSATFVEENIPYPHFGTFRGGVTVIYGDCVSSSPILIGTITYQGNGTSAPCSMLDTAGDPNSGLPMTYPQSEDCNFTEYPAPSIGPLYINSTSMCPPQCLVRTESRTWGNVKALYRR